MHSSLLPYIALCSDDAQEHALKLQKLLSDPEVSESDNDVVAPNTITLRLCADCGRSGGRCRGDNGSITQDTCGACGVLAPHPSLGAKV